MVRKKRRTLDKSFFYEHRYTIGYGAMAVILSLILLFVSLNLPGGLSKREIDSAIISDSISFSNPSSFAIANLPFHLLQRLSFSLFGLSTFSIKLPALFAALGTVFGMIILLRTWFKPSLAVLSTIIIITTGQFLLIASSGTPDIMYLFWSVWILALSGLVARTKEIKLRLRYKVLLLGMIALSLYSPLSIYILLALALAIVSHPHLRHLLKTANKKNVTISLIVFGSLLLPLLVAIIFHPSLLLTLLGAPPSAPSITHNIVFLFHHYFNFINATDISPAYITFNITAITLIAIGVARLIKTRATTRSYIIGAWVLLLIIPILIYPQNTNVMFIPLVLLLTMGLDSMLSYWYRLFPYNPYARVIGLIPIIILISTVVAAGLENYIYGYSYNPSITSYFSKDISLLPKDSSILLVSPEEKSFYEVLAKHRPGLVVVTEVPTTATTFTATRQGRPKAPSGYTLKTIINNSNYRQADRYYIFTKATDK